MDISEVDKSYLAGIIDGEGCISVSKNPRNGRNYYRLILDITTTSNELNQWLEDKFGGIVRTTYARNKNRTDMQGWTVSGNQCQDILRLTLPYLIIKKHQAELALLMTFGEYGGSCRWGYSDDEETLRGMVMDEIHQFNHKNGNKGSYIRVSIKENICHTS